MLAYVRLIVRYRVVVLGLLLLLTILSAGVLSRVKLSGSLVDLFLGASPEYERYLERVKTFGSDTFIIAFSDVVHLCSSYQMEISKGERKDQAIEKSCSEVGAARMYTSVTTFLGFVSIAVAPAPVTRQMGVVLGVGVGLALFIAMTVTPIIFSIMKAPHPMRVGAASKAQFFLIRVIDFVVHLTRNRPRAIVSGFALLLVLTAAGVTRIRFETDITKRLAPDNPIRVDAKYFGRHFAGTEYADIFLEAPEPGGLIDPGLISRVSAYRNSLLTIPEGALYIVKKGVLAVFSRGKGSFRRPIAVLKTGDVFGEYSALLNKPCTATVMAKNDLEVYALQRNVLVEMAQRDSTMAQLLEKLGEERLQDTMVYMPYFQLVQELGA